MPMFISQQRIACDRSITKIATHKMFTSLQMFSLASPKRWVRLSNSNAKRSVFKRSIVEPGKKSPDLGDGSSRLCCAYGASNSAHVDCERMNHFISFINWLAIQNVFWSHNLACDDEVAQVRQFLLEVFFANHQVAKLFVHFLISRTLVQVSFQQRKRIVRLVHLLVG